MARLVYQDAQGRQAIELDAATRLGRHPDNTIQVLDTIVSKEHCVIERQGHMAVLRDLGSMNGTYVNGERVAGVRPLHHGDMIYMGTTAFMYDDGVNPFHFELPPPCQGMIAQKPAPKPGWVQRSTTPIATPIVPEQLLQQPQPQAALSSVNVNNEKRAIGVQVSAQAKEFLPFDEASRDAAALRLDYERLRITWELLREIGQERDIDRLLDKILVALFRFVSADRGVILLEERGDLVPRAHRRRDGKNEPINLSSTILNHVIKERAGVLSHDAGSDFAASGGKSMFLNRISSAIVVPLLHERAIIGVLWLDSETIASFSKKDLELLTAVGNQVAVLISNTILATKVQKEVATRERFSRLLSPNVAEQVVSGKLDIKKGGVRVPNATVFNSDLRGFTRMSEETTAEKMVEILNEYFELMVEAIFKYEGTLDKFMGDGIMAFWGAPAVQADDAVRSVQCALEQMEILESLNAHRVSMGEKPLATGIGIHTGPLISGYVGSSKSLSYTVIGDTVNTSARLCGIAAGGQIIISEATAAQLGGRFRLEALPDASLKGKEKPLKVFSVRR
ncbi:MAG TPA: adenylate/guanylate cyclase domain-containing protein [Kofleriaceae bacterium]|nr:adenylate/guanylate cyclase domain-containing protein [Kofleriaceae bacterium]